LSAKSRRQSCKRGSQRGFSRRSSHRYLGAGWAAIFLSAAVNLEIPAASATLPGSFFNPSHPLSIMLAFVNSPDALFQAVVSESLERAIDLLKDQDSDILPDSVQALFGSNATIRDMLLQLHQAHVDSDYVFRFTSYHIVLIYFCVDFLCETYAEGVEDGLRSAFTVQGSPVLELDAMELCQFFFPDPEFLEEIDLLCAPVDDRELEFEGFCDTQNSLMLPPVSAPQQIQLVPVALDDFSDWRPDV
jgi:hypothetical protein